MDNICTAQLHALQWGPTFIRKCWLRGLSELSELSEQQQWCQQQQWWQQQQGLCWLWKKYGVGRGKAAAQVILPQPAKSLLLLPLLLLPLLPTLLLLKPLLLLTSQMATLGLPGQGQAQGQAKTLGQVQTKT